MLKETERSVVPSEKETDVVGGNSELDAVRFRNYLQERIALENALRRNGGSERAQRRAFRLKDLTQRLIPELQRRLVG